MATNLVKTTFGQFYTQLMSIINRPLTETVTLAGAKWEINQAVKYLQRNQAFAYTERLAQFTYQAGILYYDIGSICEGVLRDIMSVQKLNVSGLPQGKPTRIMTYNQLQSFRMHFSRTHPRVEGDWYQLDAISDWMSTIESGWAHDMVAFLAGQNFGLYPTPTGTSVTVLINCHIWLPTLVADSDNNFFLDYASDVVMMIALKRMHIYMKSDARYQVSEAEFKDAMSTLLAWDSQVRESPNTIMSPANP